MPCRNSTPSPGSSFAAGSARCASGRVLRVEGVGPESSARWRWAVTVAFGLGGITISAWGPRLPAIKADLGIGTGTIGLLLAGVTVGSILGLLGSTPLLHRLGGRRASPA